jgi:prophage DNA circulation protein
MYGKELLKSEPPIAHPAFIIGSNFAQYLHSWRLHE